MQNNTADVSRVAATVRFIPLTPEMIDELIEHGATLDMREGDMLGIDAGGAIAGRWREL